MTLLPRPSSTPAKPSKGTKLVNAIMDQDHTNQLRTCHPESRVLDHLERGWWLPETVLNLFDGHVLSRGDAPAMTDPQNLSDIAGISPGSLTWCELDARIDDIAATLHAHGVGPGHVVAVLLPNSIALAATYLALWRLGAIAAPMPASYRRHELSRIVESSEAVAVVTATRLHDRAPHEEALTLIGVAPSLRCVFTFGPTQDNAGVPLDGASSTADDINAVRKAYSQLDRTVNDCITICWTSGTEAAPKGVPRCHADWLAIGRAVQDGLRADSDSIILGPFPMVNMAGFATSLLPWLLSGAHLVQHHPLDIAVFLNQVQRHHVTHASMPPTVLSMLLQNPNLLSTFDLSSLHTVGSGGAPLPPGVVRDWQNDLGIEVLNFFGSNEGVCLLGAACDTPDPMIRAEYLPNYGATTRTWVTSVAERTSVRLVDLTTGEVVTRVGGRGELRLKGPTVFAGYLAGTAEKGPFDDDGYLCSGDVFELCGESGEYLKFVDRSKEIIIRGGMNIAPAEIEGLLLEHPHVSDIAIVGYDDAVLGEKCCAVVVPMPEASVSLDALVEFLRAKDIASFKLPERLVTVEELPRNPVGKLQRRDLRVHIAQNL
ncbi:MAG: class I adenylate-forming enzyme family protein [Rhodococcus sp. (in: high G+C Gram-positive bacteria)]|uniref:class I adenylate-forming enzyme family protein n=1 Tax=Rhodococcus sp. TaxID=1831 RepID=UPI002AD7AAD9|nr:class I adenylate-forming enzyme family protein [Rhodococcus sp. (in: high G+C Gram-positive bacteria)]